MEQRLERKATGSTSIKHDSVVQVSAGKKYWIDGNPMASVSGAVDVMGIALGTATVTVGGQAPYRKREYFRKELSVDNSTLPVWKRRLPEWLK